MIVHSSGVVVAHDRTQVELRFGGELILYEAGSTVVWYGLHSTGITNIIKRLSNLCSVLYSTKQKTWGGQTDSVISGSFGNILSYTFA